jgi:hypothetical protein
VLSKNNILSTLAMWVIALSFMWRAFVDMDSSYRPFAFIAGILGLLLASAFYLRRADHDQGEQPSTAI